MLVNHRITGVCSPYQQPDYISVVYKLSYTVNIYLSSLAAYLTVGASPCERMCTILTKTATFLHVLKHENLEYVNQHKTFGLRSFKTKKFWYDIVSSIFKLYCQ